MTRLRQQMLQELEASQLLREHDSRLLTRGRGVRALLQQAAGLVMRMTLPEGARFVEESL